MRSLVCVNYFERVSTDLELSSKIPSSEILSFFLRRYYSFHSTHLCYTSRKFQAQKGQSSAKD